MGGGCCHWQRSWPTWSRRWGSRSWGKSRVRSAETAAPADCRHTASWSRPWTHRFFQGADDAGAFPVVCAGSPRVGPGPAEALDTPLPGAGARRGRGAWRWRCGPGRCARPLGRADRAGGADGGCSTISSPLLPCPRRRIQGGHRVHAVLHGWGPSDPGISRPVQGWVGGEELRTLHPSPPLALLPLQVSSCTERCEGQQAACWRTDGTFDQAAAQRLVGSGDCR